MIKVEKGLSMQILIKELNLILMKMEWENPVKIFLTKRMCELEYYFNEIFYRNDNEFFSIKISNVNWMQRKTAIGLIDRNF